QHLFAFRPHSAPVFPAPLSIFFTHPASPEIYTLSLHDALPISHRSRTRRRGARRSLRREAVPPRRRGSAGRDGLLRAAPLAPCQDRKSTRLNSSHLGISYAVFCLKKKKTRPPRLQRALCSQAQG